MPSWHRTVAAALLAICAAGGSAQAQQTWLSRQITFLLPPAGTTNCVLFTLQGVGQADPVKPGDPVFAISTADPTWATRFSMLLTSASNAQPVNAVTTGTLSCGFADTTTVSVSYAR